MPPFEEKDKTVSIKYQAADKHTHDSCGQKHPIHYVNGVENQTAVESQSVQTP